jgi:hypothetical protein
MKTRTFQKIELSEFQRSNLKKLADYLLAGKLKARFDMELFSDMEFCGTYCGTVGCALGHGPYAGIEKIDGEGWMKYSYRCFIDERESDHLNYAWKWCFEGTWHKVDNSPEGAAKRINIILEKGVPSDWKEQMRGKIPLGY